MIWLEMRMLRMKNKDAKKTDILSALYCDVIRKNTFETFVELKI